MLACHFAHRQHAIAVPVPLAAELGPGRDANTYGERRPGDVDPKADRRATGCSDWHRLDQPRGPCDVPGKARANLLQIQSGLVGS